MRTLFAALALSAAPALAGEITNEIEAYLDSSAWRAPAPRLVGASVTESASGSRAASLDRGAGVATSLFGTYIEKGEWLAYLFFEYEISKNDEYNGRELRTSLDGIDYLGESETHEIVLFIGHGLTEDIVLEFETALFESTELERAANDTTSGMPLELSESGLGTVEAQIRWRFRRETDRRPELFTFLEVAFPFQRDKVLIGASDWEFALGIGAIKQISWGTLVVRGSLLYEADESELALGEFAIELMRDLSPRTRVIGAIEGEDDEIAIIGEVQYALTDRITFKLNVGAGLTEKASDLEIEVGVVFRF